MAWVAIWSGVIGSASDMVGVWIEPVIAQLMTIFAIAVFLPCRPGTTPDVAQNSYIGVAASAMPSLAMMESTMSRGCGSIEIVIGRSSAIGSSSAANWLSRRAAGMK